MKKNYSNPKADEFYRSLSEQPKDIPFSFMYDGKKYEGFDSEFFTLTDKTVLAEDEKETTNFVFLHNKILKVSIKMTHYFSHGVTEWTVWFENIGDKNTAVIEDPRIELAFKGDRPTLKGILGDHYNQYAPYCVDIKDMDVDFFSNHGKPTHIYFPYFNLEHGNEGTMLAIGWSCTWSARFTWDGEKTVYTANSTNGLKTYLKPGESIRTALFVMAPYTTRNEHYATNYWRSWFIEHNLPKADAAGNALTPFSTARLAYDSGKPNSDGSISEDCTTWKPSMEKLVSEGIKVHYRWFDAGWYISPSGESAVTDWSHTLGTWELDPNKWPGDTFRQSTDFAREHGMKTLVWFEPERTNDPESMVKNYGYNIDWALRMEGEKAIVNNIGNPDCRRYTTDRVCKMLRENKVELYREDNNLYQAPIFRYTDANIEGENRNGITECKMVDAHYKMWDEIISCTLEYGGCGFIDSCASGGGCNDIESMRRAVPLLRSDSDRTSTALRLSMTASFNKWIPFCGAKCREKPFDTSPVGVSDVYVWRCSYLPVLNVAGRYTHDPDLDFDNMRFGIREWNKVSPYLLKDFYTLTRWHSPRENMSFTAFCYFDPEKEDGIVLAIRQEGCDTPDFSCSLPFAKNTDRYLVTDEDTGESFEISNQLNLHFDSPRTAKLLWIKHI